RPSELLGRARGTGARLRRTGLRRDRRAGRSGRSRGFVALAVLHRVFSPAFGAAFPLLAEVLDEFAERLLLLLGGQLLLDRGLHRRERLLVARQRLRDFVDVVAERCLDRTA